MKYGIYHNEITLPNDVKVVGLEIQPPIDGTAEGTATMLTQKPGGFSNGTEHLANNAIVTRNDEAGTAIVATPNHYANTTSAELAKLLGALIDPCGQHKINYVPPLPE